jgi:DNA-binding CsgD family transcriptional regulator
MVGVQILAFYFFTRFTANTISVLPDGQKVIHAPNTVRSEYAQFVQPQSGCIRLDSPLSRRRERLVPLLSKREIEVIEAVLAGCSSYKKIAASLNISVNTVKTHLQHIYQTTDVSNIDDLALLFRGFSENHP